MRLDGRALGKSDKLRADSWLDVDWQERREPEIVPIAVPDLGIVYDDDDIVVVDKPAGVAAHPSVGWEGPTVLGALAAGGYRIATTGAAERQGAQIGIAVPDQHIDQQRPAGDGLRGLLEHIPQPVVEQVHGIAQVGQQQAQRGKANALARQPAQHEHRQGQLQEMVVLPAGLNLRGVPQ